MRTIAIINQKGGCGKTTVSINLASALARKGQRTLLVDMDPQSHCAVGLAVPEEQIEKSIYDVLANLNREKKVPLNDILWQISDNFELAPSSIDLAAFEQQMSGVLNRENCLKTLLESVSSNYDYVVVDCPPSVGLLTFNALRASSDVMVPVETGFFSLHGLSKQLQTLNVLSEQCQQDINLMVLASMYDIRTKMGREILAELRKHFGDKMFKTVINFNTKLKEAASLGQPVLEYDPASKGSKDFHNLADELMSTDTHAHKRELVSSLSNQLDAISCSAQDLLETVDVSLNAQNKSADTDSKICEFYGVKQMEGGTIFSTLYPRATSVMVAGDFNNWQPENGQMEKVGENGAWQIKLPITPGSYNYRLVVDGVWQQDPHNENNQPNPFGEMNSILNVN